MNCPKCGATLEEDAVLCHECGASLEVGADPPQGEAAGSRWMRRVAELKWIILFYLVMSVLCMSCACCLGYRTQWILWRLGLR